MNARFAYEIAFRITCSICGKQVGDVYKICCTGECLQPALPDGWRVLDGNPICDVHEIVVKSTVGPVDVDPMERTMPVMSVESHSITYPKWPSAGRLID